jgi:lipoyl-dependent peroxiredoxin
VLAAQRKISLSPDRYIDAEVDLGTNAGGYLVRARLNVHLPSLDRDVAQSLVDAAHANTCPYSKATRGNIEVIVNLI